MSSEKTNEQLVKELIDAFSKLKEKMEDPNYAQLDLHISQVIESQKEMKKDLSELKKMLLNPYDGAIVEIRKNTEFRQDFITRETEIEDLIEEHKHLVNWKKNITKVFVAILGSAGAIITWIITEFFNR